MDRKKFIAQGRESVFVTDLTSRGRVKSAQEQLKRQGGKKIQDRLSSTPEKRTIGAALVDFGPGSASFEERFNGK